MVLEIHRIKLRTRITDNTPSPRKIILDLQAGIMYNSLSRHVSHPCPSPPSKNKLDFSCPTVQHIIIFPPRLLHSNTNPTLVLIY
jgi:hypothetical protein